MHSHHARDTAVGASRKRQKHWRGQGVSECSTDRSGMDIPFVHDAEEVSYQRRSAALLATSWCDKAVQTVFYVAFSCLHEDWS